MGGMLYRRWALGRIGEMLPSGCTVRPNAKTPKAVTKVEGCLLDTLGKVVGCVLKGVEVSSLGKVQGCLPDAVVRCLRGEAASRVQSLAV